MKTSRFNLFLKISLFSLALFICLSLAPCASARETFNKFNADIEINEDSSIVVTEEILVNVENIEINRGIIRALPVE